MGTALLALLFLTALKYEMIWYPAVCGKVKPLQKNSNQMAPSSAIKFLTYNCNWLNDKIKTERVLSALVKTQAEVIFLQETHLHKNTKEVFKCNKLFHQI